MSDTLAAALHLAHTGYAVHWCRPRSKAPLAEGWSAAAVRQNQPHYEVGTLGGMPPGWDRDSQWADKFPNVQRQV